jgi:glyceraldehyde-3-phosphate dehydrogenase (NADP+)
MLIDDRLKILSFTGSDKVGWLLKSKAGKKKVFLEMVGNAATIIDQSADLKRAAKKIAYGSYLNAGQICISTQRIFVMEPVFEEFVKLFLEETKMVKSGDVYDENVINGPMISKNDLIRIDTWVKEAVTQGAEILEGGYIIDEKANIYAPTVLTNTNPDMKIWQNEAFAPVVLIEKTPDFKTAVAQVNNSRYGLQAGVFTNNFEHILYSQKNIETGGVIINDIPGFRIDSMPYGGIKDSGLGREGAYYAMTDFTEPKLIVLGN